MTVVAHTTRARLEAKIEELVSLLDLIDGDPDFEPTNDNEPALGWPDGLPGQGAVRLRNIEEDDRELEDEHDEESDPLEGNGDEDDTSFAEDEFSGKDF